MLPIYIVSLSDAIERRENMRAQCEILSLEFEFFDAVDGRNGFLPDQEKQFDREKAKRKSKELTDTEIGCAISHALLCKHISESDHADGAIVLEDDAILADDFAEILKQGVLENLGEDLITLRHANAYAYLWPAPTVFKHYQLCKPVHSPWGNVAYYVSQNGAAEIYKRSWPICSVSDWGFDIREIGAKVLTPRILDHPPMEGDQSQIGTRGYLKRLTKLQRLYNWKSISFKFRRILSVKVS